MCSALNEGGAAPACTGKTEQSDCSEHDHGGVGEILGNMYPAGRVPLGDLSLLVQTVQSILRSPPAPPTHNPYPLNAMLNATIELYSELAAEKDSLQ